VEPQDTGIPGVLVRPLRRHEDSRGWLMEFFRDDLGPEGFRPAMGYLSVTRPGIARGPHEHRDQTDGFAFLSGEYDLFLWENRPGAQEASVRLRVGEANPVFVLVPPGVVHAYRNVGESDAFVINIPNRLYGGWMRREPVDEIRHEERADARFRLPEA
jgi:dTDP-4-dehydrorhamnose 3,5-epimerase